MPSGKRKLTQEQAHAKIRANSALSALGPGEARLSICNRLTGEVRVINFADPAFACDRDLAELVNKYHPEFKDGGY